MCGAGLAFGRFLGFSIRSLISCYANVALSPPSLQFGTTSWEIVYAFDYFFDKMLP